MMTTQDKLIIGGGIALALGGGIYYFTQKAKDKKQLENTDNSSYMDENPQLPASSLPSSSTPGFNPSSQQVEQPKEVVADTFAYKIGQEVMANGFYGTKGYEAKKMADGNYMSDGKLKATFKKGDKIGKIIWVGVRSDGTYRYVIERNGAWQNAIYWIASKDVIKPIGKILGTITPKGTPTNSTSNLQLDLILRKGSKGSEVKKLQEILGISADGDFGSNTEKALINLKGVKEISLNGMNSIKTTSNGQSYDVNLLLKKGSKNFEVKTLQTLLKISADGIFGQNTENALFTQKKVREIRLKDWK